MGLMPIIFTALVIFIISSAVILLISYILYKIRPKQKPYIEISTQKPAAEVKKPYYTIPVYEQPVRKPVQRSVNRKPIRYSDVNRFEVLNQQKPRYMQSTEVRSFTAARDIPQQNIYAYYSNGYNDQEFRTVTP